MKVRVMLPCLMAGGGAMVATLGNVLYSMSPCGEVGVLAGKGGIVFWYMALPGFFAGVPLDSVGIKYPWSSILGGTLLWALIGLVIARVVSRRRSVSPDS